MYFKNSTTILISAIALLGFIIHYTVLQLVTTEAIRSGLAISLPVMYVVAALLSGVILLVLRAFHQKKPELTGYIFLIATTIKLVLFYVLSLLLGKTAAEVATVEKMNLFVTFVLFLTIEVVYTAKLLNINNQKR